MNAVLERWMDVGRGGRPIVWAFNVNSLSLSQYVDIQPDIPCYIHLYVSGIKSYVAT